MWRRTSEGRVDKPTRMPGWPSPWSPLADVILQDLEIEIEIPARNQQVCRSERPAGGTADDKDPLSKAPKKNSVESAGIGLSGRRRGRNNK